MTTLGVSVQPAAGDRGTRPLVLLHGFTQTKECFGEFAGLLSRRRRLVSVDLPGHGASGGVRADLEEGAALVAEVITATCEGRADLLGYSLGGRFALHLALRHPEVLGGLVVLSATAGLAQAAREERRRRDDALACELETSGDVGAFLSRWLASPMFVHLGEEASGRDLRLRNTAAGLASSLRLAGTGSQTPLWDRLEHLAVPALFVAGATDPRFVAAARTMAAAVPAGVFSVVAGAGHAVHLEQPLVCAQVVESFLETLEQPQAA